MTLEPPAPDAVVRASSSLPGLAPDADAEAWAALRDRVALASIAGPAPIDIRGKDAADYLHRRLSQSVKKLAVGRGVHALQLNGEGRMECDLLLYRTGDTQFVALVEGAFAGSAAALLDKYVLMDEVEVAGPSESDVLLTLLGPRASDALGGLLGSEARAAADADRWSFAAGSFEGGLLPFFRDGRGTAGCIHLRVPRAAAARVLTALRGAIAPLDGRIAGPAVLEYARLAQGITRFGADTTPATIPLEANLRGALDLNKGCFPGQEFLARINNLGHPAKVLARLRFDAAAAPAVGDAVGDPSGAAESEGRVTSVRTLAGVAEGLALAVLPWRLRGLGKALVAGDGRRVIGGVELLGEYPDASGARRSI